MDLLILGFPQAGKTTVFDALTRGRAAGGASAGGAGHSIGVARISDPRLDVLAAMYHPQRIVPADIRFIDTPGLGRGRRRGSGIGGELVNQMQGADALVHVVRAFDDPSVPVADGAATPAEAVTSMDLELTMIDLGILERRSERIAAMMKGARADERVALERERGLFSQVQQGLEEEVPVSRQQLPPEVQALVATYNLVTAKPMLLVLNVGEDRADDPASLDATGGDESSGSGRRAFSLCGKLEMELAQMDPEEEAEFRESFAAGDSGIDRVALAALELLGLASFFTVGEDEVRAWIVARDAPAVKAAGKVHTDIERGFIRAEVAAYDDLVSAGGMSEARKLGRVRLEGKEYPVKDGDIITYLFNV